MYKKYVFMFLLCLVSFQLANSRKGSIQDKTIVLHVKKEFLIRMKELVHYLPTRRQCSILHNIASDSNSTSSRVADVLFTSDSINTLLSCQFNTSWTISPEDNTSFITNAYNKQLVQLFNKIPEPFQCYIVHTIAVSKQNRTIPVKKVERYLLQEYSPMLRLGKRCSRVSHQKRDKLLSIGLVDATLKRTPLKGGKGWIKKFKSAISMVYFRSFTKTRKTTKKKPHNASRDRSNPERETNIYTLPILARTDFEVRVLKVTKEDEILRVNFYILLKGDVFGTIVRSVEIIHAFDNNKSRRKFSHLLGAEQVEFSLPKNKRKSEIRKRYTSKISTIKQLLPKHLLMYYKSFDNSGHCFILLHIAMKLGKELDHVERILTTINYLSREFLCSLYDENKSTETNTVYDSSENDNPWDEIKDGGNSNKTNYEDLFEEKGAPSRGQISTLEIVLFVLLALLCLAILAFLVNCVLFSVRGNKGKKGYNVNNQNVLAGVVFGEPEATNSNEISNLESEVNNDSNSEQNQNDDGQQSPKLTNL